MSQRLEFASASLQRGVLTAQAGNLMTPPELQPQSSALRLVSGMRR